MKQILIKHTEDITSELQRRGYVGTLTRTKTITL